MNLRGTGGDKGDPMKLRKEEVGMQGRQPALFLNKPLPPFRGNLQGGWGVRRGKAFDMSE